MSELQILANLDHPHIVRVFTSDFLRDTPFFTMEYMEGGSLAAALKPKPGTSEPNLPPVPAALRLIRQVAGACAAAHAKGVIHRDLKPGNILLAPDGSPRLADFGLARQLDRDTAFTRSGGLGTPGYMPPEQVTAKNGEIGKWSDIYGLGAILYHLFTGCPPFKEDTAEKTITRMLADPPVRPRAIKPELPMGLEAIVLKSLERDPKDRYQTVAEFLADLDKYEAGQTPAAPPMTRARRAKRWVGRNRRGIGSAALVALVVAGAFVLGAAPWLKPVPVVANEAERPEPIDPVAAKAKVLEAINADLLAGKSVTLVGAKGEPLWYDAPTGAVAFGDNPTATDKEPGGCYFNSFGLTILKLLDPPIDSYTVELEMQHVRGNVQANRGKGLSLGFFCGYASEVRPDGWTEQSVLSVGFRDLDRGTLEGPPVPSGVLVESLCFAGIPGRLQNAARYPITRELPLSSGKSFPGPWRKVVADVGLDRLTFTWYPVPGQKAVLADFSLADLRTHRNGHDRVLGIVGQQLKHQFAGLPDWSPRRGIGIWASGAEIAVRNVVVTPL